MAGYQLSTIALIPFLLCATACSDSDRETSDPGSVDQDAAARHTGFDGSVGTQEPNEINPIAEPTCDDRARGIDIVEVELNQAVRRNLVDQSGSDVPLIAGRRMLVRVYVKPRPDFAPRTLRAKLMLGAHELDEEVDVQQESAVDVPASTFNFLVDAEHVKNGSELSIALAELDACAEAANSEVEGSRFPDEGAMPLSMVEQSRPFELVLVPMAVQTSDGNVIPNVDEALLDSMRDAFTAHYPIAEVDIRVREPVQFRGAIGPSDTRGWANLLQQCTELRLADGVSPSTYYHCMVSPGSQRAFCGRGCISGLATVPRPFDAVNRVGTGLGYPGQAESTAIHEMGHALGRPHAPCGGTRGVDPGYPNAQGLTETWGFSVVDNRLRAPNSTDIMGYCDNQWISAYNYRLLADRLNTVMEADVQPQILGSAQSAWWIVSVDGSGNYGDASRIDLPYAPEGEPVGAAAFVGSSSLGRTEAVFVPFAEGGGGFIYARHVTGADRIAID